MKKQSFAHFSYSLTLCLLDGETLRALNQLIWWAEYSKPVKPIGNAKAEMQERRGLKEQRKIARRRKENHG